MPTRLPPLFFRLRPRSARRPMAMDAGDRLGTRSAADPTSPQSNNCIRAPPSPGGGIPLPLRPDEVRGPTETEGMAAAATVQRSRMGRPSAIRLAGARRVIRDGKTWLPPADAAQQIGIGRVH